MATIDYVLFDNAGSQVVTWSNGEDGDFGQAIDLSAFPDKTVSSDGIATMQGSMDGTTWITLTDFSGADIVFAANTAFVIR